ncbi:MAG: SIR2 family protein [Magnetovibrionaceae bacterium]
MTSFSDLLAGVSNGTLVPYLGPGVLAGVTEQGGSAPIPADSDSLILALNDGRPMAPKLMYEFPRAAMNLELKKGRSFVTNALDAIYGTKSWTRSALHDWLAAVKPGYVIDINRDTQLQQSYADTDHYLIRGIARVGGTEYRFEIHEYKDGTYTEVGQEDLDVSKPVLFKPMGSPLPKPTYIASDADYVDYITELMGGFAIPGPIKELRKGKQYLFMGLRLTRDTERMVLTDMIYAAGEPAGYVLLKEPNKKEERFCKRQNLEIIDADWTDLLAAREAAA